MDYRKVAALAILYDIHGNLPALEEVLADAGQSGTDRYLLGGDYGAHSPWPLETVERLRGLPNTTWIRGNGERWLREPPTDRPEVMEVLAVESSGLGTAICSSGAPVRMEPRS